MHKNKTRIIIIKFPLVVIGQRYIGKPHSKNNILFKE